MTRVALLWHMHQPYYQDLMTGEHILPWVRLHALKDYWGMVALLREFPAVRVTFNLVPSLLVQLESFAREEARDRHLELGLKRADALTDEERAFCIENFFHAHKTRMIEPYPRYAELLARRGTSAPGLSAHAQAGQFSVDDLRDLQVWHKLAWIDPLYLDGDPRVRALVAKGRGFTEEDKQTLREVELELLRRVVPEYRDAARRGQVELSTSPFYHPILPLLCDTDIHLQTRPDSRMPRERFRHPEDALDQLTRAVALHERLFGRRPDGVWPSEGSVSEEIVPLVVRAGFRWIATDEEILARSLERTFARDEFGHAQQAEVLYRPYLVVADGHAVACGFRDHTLSDLIGFSYAGWASEKAADDFIGRLVEAGRRYRARDGGEATIFVILDGENAWEHFEGQGRPFLAALYQRLSAHPELQTVTMSEACASPSESLRTLAPGSWINGDFYIWIGHPDDHRAWGQLAAARRALETPRAGLGAEALEHAREEMFIAEGSDWFWWYGDDHSSEHDAAFDDLFRRHVRNVYRALEQPIPEELFVTNITTQPPVVTVEPPTGFIEPVIDGAITSYFEWIGAGCVDPSTAAGAMHQVSAARTGLALIEFGFSPVDLFLRVDGTRPMRDVLVGEAALLVKFLKPDGIRIAIRGENGHGQGELLGRGADGVWLPIPGAQPTVAIGEVVEMQVPWSVLGLGAHDAVALFVALVQGALEIEQHPRARPIEFDVPDRRFTSLNWTA